MLTTDAHVPGGRAGDVVDAIAVVRRSSRALVREARARYTVDVVKWPYRHRFDPIWQTVQWIPGWFHEGSAVVMYAVMRDAVMRADPPPTIVEIGSYLGRSTVFFGLALKDLSPAGRVIAIDPHTGDRQQLEGLAAERLATFDLFRQHCRTAGVESVVQAHVAGSLEVAAGWSEPVDLLYVDGWHSYDAVLADGEAWLPHLSPRGVVVFDDYVAYREVRDAVDELAARGLYHRWGVVFGQAVGGAASEPPAALRRALMLSGAGLRRVLRRPATGRWATAGRQATSRSFCASASD